MYCSKHSSKNTYKQHNKPIKTNKQIVNKLIKTPNVWQKFNHDKTKPESGTVEMCLNHEHDRGVI